MIRIFTCLLILSALSCDCYAQKETDVFSLKGQPYVTEQDLLLRDTMLTLLQEVCYDVPEISDEEYCMRLMIRMKVPVKADPFSTPVFDVAKDTNMLSCRFVKSSFLPVPVNGQQLSYSGTIKFFSSSKHAVRIIFDLSVYDNIIKRTFLYRGERSFRRTKGKTKDVELMRRSPVRISK